MDIDFYLTSVRCLWFLHSAVLWFLGIIGSISSHLLFSGASELGLSLALLSSYPDLRCLGMDLFISHGDHHSPSILGFFSSFAFSLYIILLFYCICLWLMRSKGTEEWKICSYFHNCTEISIFCFSLWSPRDQLEISFRSMNRAII